MSLVSRWSPNITTTWHAKDSLDEALGFFVCLARPDDFYVESPRVCLVITVGREDWRSHVHERLGDFESFVKDLGRKTVLI